MFNKCVFYVVIFLFIFCTLISANYRLRPCLTKRLNLINSSIYISGTNGEPASIAINNNLCNHFHSDFHGSTIDQGYEWIIVHFDIQKIQLVDTVTIVTRSGFQVRSINIDIFIANEISKKLTKSQGENNLPWNEFSHCGKTPPSPCEIVVEVKCKKVLNSRYVGLRRIYNPHAYCCFNFVELLVTVLDVYDDIPNVDHLDWHEGSNHAISIGCSLPESAGIKTVWNEHNLHSHTTHLLTQEGDQIHLNNIARQAVVKYTYSYVEKTTNVTFFTSPFSETLHVRYAANDLKIHSPEIVTVEEGEMIDINCTSEAGYPNPQLQLELDDVVGNVSLGEEDLFGGRAFHAHIFLPAQLKWNDKVITCTLIQPGFRNLTKHVVLHVKDKREGITYGRNFPTYFKPTLSSEDGYMLHISKYITNAFPNQFNISCMKNRTTYFAVINRPLSDSYVHLLSAGEYLCEIVHKTCRKEVKIVLLKGSNRQVNA